jgi:hypothetical protein
MASKTARVFDASDLILPIAIPTTRWEKFRRFGEFENLACKID